MAKAMGRIIAYKHNYSEDSVKVETTTVYFSDGNELTLAGCYTFLPIGSLEVKYNKQEEPYTLTKLELMAG